MLSHMIPSLLEQYGIYIHSHFIDEQNKCSKNKRPSHTISVGIVSRTGLLTC